MSDKHDELDSILFDLGEKWIELTKGKKFLKNNRLDRENGSFESINKAKAALESYIYKEFMELIGPDEVLGTRPPALDGTAWEIYETKRHGNTVRTELRTKLAAKYPSQGEEK